MIARLDAAASPSVTIVASSAFVRDALDGVRIFFDETEQLLRRPVRRAPILLPLLKSTHREPKTLGEFFL